MDLLKEKDATIFYMKFLKTILVTKDLKETLRMAQELGIDYTSVELLKMLRDLIKAYTQETSLPLEANNNIYEYLNLCRFSFDDTHSERVELCNEIIALLNVSKGKPPYPLYPSMINSYFENFMERIHHHVLYAVNPESEELLLSSVAELEYLILFLHSTLIDDEEFAFDISEDLVLSLEYLLATNHLLREDPTLLRDKLYLSRLRYILKNNDLLLQEYQGKPDDDCIFELDDEDEAIIKDKKFWKLHTKIKKKVEKNT